MKVLAKNSEFTLQFNGSSTYMIVDIFGECLMTKQSERTALNYYNKVSKLSGC